MSVCVDNYLKDKEILSSKEFLDKEFWRNQPSRWLGVFEKPRTRFQKLVYTLWEPLIRSEEHKFEGFEFWSNVLESGANLEPHRDRDEKLFLDTGKEDFPMVGSVYYPIVQNVLGGELKIFGNGVSCDPTEIIQPVQNRIVFFEAGKHWHTVAPVTSGTRVHFAINVWEKKPYGLGKDGGISF